MNFPNIKIAFHFENKNVDQWSGAAIDLDNWRMPAKCLGINHMAIIDLSDARHRMQDAEMQLDEYDSLVDFETANANERLVYIEEAHTLQGVTSYAFGEYPHDWEIPTWYIFGPAQGFQPSVDDGRDYLSLPMVNPMALEGFQAASLMGGLLLPNLLAIAAQNA